MEKDTFKNRYALAISSLILIKKKKEEIIDLSANIAKSIFISENQGEEICDKLLNDAIVELKSKGAKIIKSEYVGNIIKYENIEISLHDNNVLSGIKKQIITGIYQKGKK